MPPFDRRSRNKRRTIAAVVAAMAIGAATAAVLVTTGDSDSGTLSFPSSYVVEYREAINGVPQWEVLSARRPFDGSDLTYRTAARPGADATASAGTISSKSVLFTVTDKGVRQVSGRQPGPPSNDIQLGLVLPDVSSRHLGTQTSQTMTVAGRTCHVVRVAEPVSGPLAAVNPDVGHDDICLDSAGLVLSEAWTYHDRVVLQRTAVTVSLAAAWPVGVPRPPSTDNASPAPASAASVDPVTHAETFLATPPTPGGFHADGALAFRLPDPQAPADSVARSVVWTFVDGPRLITVEAGAERGGGLPWTTSDTVTRPVDLPDLGAATSALRSDGPEIRIPVPGGRWVRVRGTVSLPVLISYAKRLHLSAAGRTAG